MDASTESKRKRKRSNPTVYPFVINTILEHDRLIIVNAIVKNDIILYTNTS